MTLFIIGIQMFSFLSALLASLPYRVRVEFPKNVSLLALIPVMGSPRNQAGWQCFTFKIILDEEYRSPVFSSSIRSLQELQDIIDKRKVLMESFVTRFRECIGGPDAVCDKDVYVFYLKYIQPKLDIYSVSFYQNHTEAELAKIGNDIGQLFGYKYQAILAAYYAMHTV